MFIVNSRRVASALALIVALIGASIVPVYAGTARAQCAGSAANAEHACCKTPILTACCTDRSDTSTQGGPTPAKFQVTPGFSAAPAIFFVDLRNAVRSTGAIQPTPPRAGPLDLPTLLSSLLI